ncbi:DNA polymerase-like protein gamma [Xylogone sp. PMI_703]|nr:DNA polymerase-like protein gamma [Xylogone sp. PMI_703]
MLLSMHRCYMSKSCSGLARFTKHKMGWQAPRALSAWRSYATNDVTPIEHSSDDRSSLLRLSNARFNEIGVQQVSEYIHSQIFPGTTAPTPQDPDNISKDTLWRKQLVELSRDHLQRHELLGKNTDNTPPIAFDLPELQGETKTLDEHFFRLGSDAAEPYLAHAKEFTRANAPPKPREWIHQSGWTRYPREGPPEAIEAPSETMLCFDTEVMWKESSFAVMACAVSPTAWYAWISPWLLGESENDRQLIPLGDPSQPRIIVGHNVGYDRARVAEEYDVQQSKNCFLDTMSLHVAVNGMCSRQRPTWIRHRKNRELRDKIASQTNNTELANVLSDKALTEEEEELWVGRSSINSLRDVAKFHLNVTIDKAQRDQFGELDRQGVRNKLDELLDYCAADVEVTHRVYKTVFPNFLNVCPHPVSFAALRHLSSVILPVDKSWESYIKKAEATYDKLSRAVRDRLIFLTDKAVGIKDDSEKWSNDPWLRQLDWSIKEIRWVKGKRKGDPPRLAARQKMPGMPKWYKDLFKADESISLTVRTRIAPLLLRLAWDGHPLVWSDKYGWTFAVPVADAAKYREALMQECTDFEEKDMRLRDDKLSVYFKIPHKDGSTARCVNPMAKGYMPYFENGTLSSEYPYAKEALEMNASCSYWISARERIKSQMAVYKSDGAKVPSRAVSTSEIGYILPQIIPMGTITRRAVENTWLTASNAKANRVGSELKSMIKSPPGYCFVGADVDSEELWIASLVGDAQFKLHGGSAVGFMTLEGTKAAGTDLHSRTAKILGITRNDAKVFNYGRIYGAGLKFASALLQQFNKSLSESDTIKIASNLYKATKGIKTTRKTIHKRPFWRGGTESFVFNKLEEFAEQERPRTPVLGAGITEALMTRFINQGAFMTSRINWAIQSSGVDYLHLLIVSMDYLIRRFNIDARLAITVHDEIRYLVADEDKYRAAMALQVSNIWTRAMFAQQMGIDDLPQSCAYFSAVDVDRVLRKEVNMDCITPSHPEKIPHGESLDVIALLKRGTLSHLDSAITPKDPPAPERFEYMPRQSVMESMQSLDINFIKAQITADDKELREIVKEHRKLSEAANSIKEAPTRTVLPYHAQPHLVEEPKKIREFLGSDLIKNRTNTGKGKPLDWEKQNSARPKSTTKWQKPRIV